LFALIDMEMADANQATAKQREHVRRSAEFDPEDGRPTRYRSLMFGDAGREIEWRILEFEPAGGGRGGVGACTRLDADLAAGVGAR